MLGKLISPDMMCSALKLVEVGTRVAWSSYQHDGSDQADCA
jgi:hypothetical protein